MGILPYAADLDVQQKRGKKPDLNEESLAVIEHMKDGWGLYRDACFNWSLRKADKYPFTQSIKNIYKPAANNLLKLGFVVQDAKRLNDTTCRFLLKEVVNGG